MDILDLLVTLLFGRPEGVELAWLPLLGMGLGLAGKLFGAGASASAKNRQAQDEQNLDRDKLRLAGRADFRDAQNDAYKNAMRSAHTLNWKPIGAPGGIPDVYAGREVSGDAKTAAQAMQRRALLELMQGKAFEPTAAAKPGKWEKFMNIASPILGVGGAIAGGIGQQQPGATPPTMPGLTSMRPFGNLFGSQPLGLDPQNMQASQVAGLTSPRAFRNLFGQDQG